MKKLTIAALVLLGAAGTAEAAGNAATGQTKAATCAACHGMDGNSPANPVWPKLAGQHPDYIVKQLAAFKKGMLEPNAPLGPDVRRDPTMSAMAMPLSEQDMADLAAYFADQKRTVGTASPEKLAAGEKIFRGGIPEKGVAACMSCHGPAGTGNAPANFPSVASQHGAYTAKAMKDFRAGTRATDPGKMMQGVVAKMTDAEIEAVADYMAGLHN